MKQDPEVKIFNSDLTFIIQNKSLTLRVAFNFVDGTRYCTSKNHFDTRLKRYNTRKYSLGEYIYFLVAKTTECTFLVYTGQVLGRLNDKIFSRVNI